jgi:hypothetical protein
MRIRAGLKAVYGIAFLAVAGLFYFGRDYYLAPPGRRIRLPLHPVLRQSGSVGHLLGILGTLFMVTLLAYSLRKRLRFMRSWGNLNDWLEVHIFLGLSGPVLVLFHTVFEFSGLVGICFWAMTLVVVSGIIGRYIYQAIPRSISGMELNRIELEAEEIGITYELRKRLPGGHPLWERLADLEKGIRPTASGSLWMGRETARLRAAFKRTLKKARALNFSERRKLLRLVVKRQKLIRRKEFLDKTQKILHYWHLLHAPFVVLMFLILLVHIYVSVRMGNTWIL